MDPATLATTVVASFLVPYISMGADKVTQGLAARLGQKAADHFNKVSMTLWSRVRETFKPGNEQKALDLFEEDPEELQGKVTKTLEQKLEQDDHLREELNKLVEAPAPGSTTTGAEIRRAVNAVVQDFRHANLSHARRVNIIGAQRMYGGSPSPDPSSSANTLPNEP